MNFETGFVGDRLEEGEQELARRKKRIIIVAASVLIILIALAFWTHRGEDASSTIGDAGLSPRVTVVQPGRSAISMSITATGTLAARREMPVGVSGEGGAVAAVFVEPGDWVRAGQVLARVERSVQAQQGASLAAAIQVARADARLAQNDLDRATELVSNGFVSKADLDRRTATRDAALARVKVAEAQYNEQRARIGRLDIRAPAAGLVLTRSVEPGQIISSASGVLFRIAKGGEMELIAKLSEVDLAALAVGDRVDITPVGGKQVYTGHVWQISPVIDPQTRLGMARIVLPYHRDIRPGGFASARIVSGTAEAPVLPESAIQHDDKGSFVYIANAKNIAERRDVKIGQVSAAGVSIVGGLNGTERVIALAGGFLSAGQKVEPQAEQPSGGAKAAGQGQ
ncbi:MAG: efflux RND transporter periplasmic adaptor subunit [Sphingobium sp.]|nr:efflux RND transporter periplasmic adaptor subunit [Sphingobium sp.]MBP6112297.1 efflux RND transporter periplasmic adaptor subunit [Sphingobium sp.]MBP8671652.1 efflux RND transporter periplasmic adaptor subunit [Sphingobium sp.]MBP9158645.1 efflux RND transporter periplasmic adaptor subunit [Sphingobium sp.]MCC6483153.1 efflux RND transporter periplasmic adaptor subunit [Sphingomonadaceae bacterium]